MRGLKIRVLCLGCNGRTIRFGHKSATNVAFLHLQRQRRASKTAQTARFRKWTPISELQWRDIFCGRHVVSLTQEKAKYSAYRDPSAFSYHRKTSNVSSLGNDARTRVCRKRRPIIFCGHTRHRSTSPCVHNGAATISSCVHHRPIIPRRLSTSRRRSASLHLLVEVLVPVALTLYTFSCPTRSCPMLDSAHFTGQNRSRQKPFGPPPKTDV